MSANTGLLFFRRRGAKIPDSFCAVGEGRKLFAFGDDDYVFKILIARSVGTTLLANRPGGEAGGGGARFGVLMSVYDAPVVLGWSREPERDGEQ